MKKQKNQNKYEKVVDERYSLSKKRGGGRIRIEAWEDTNGDVVKYSMAYINYDLYQYDNGRVIGYDNAHEHHHRHYFGDIEPVDNFICYEEVLDRFENEI